ncbi:putative ribonuclease H-like domain-containing protein [Tanacetum coccineum]
MDPLIRCTTLPSHSRSLKVFLFHFSWRSILFGIMDFYNLVLLIQLDTASDAIPDENLPTFHGIKDAKTLWEAIKTRFRGNKESKKMQKTILKQQYKNFTASRSKGLDKTYDRDKLLPHPMLMMSGFSFFVVNLIVNRLDNEDLAQLISLILKRWISNGRCYTYDDEDVGAEVNLNNLETAMNGSPIPITRIHKDHPKDQIIRDINSAIQTRRMINFSKENAMVIYISKQRRTNHKDYQNCLFACFLSQIEPKKAIQALTDSSWIEAMQEELLQFQLQKSAFLYGTIEEEVYVCQPPSFEDLLFPDKVYKVEKALYSLHQAPRAWCMLVISSLGPQRSHYVMSLKKEDVIFINQDKYVAEILKKFDFVNVKTASTPMEPNKALVKDEEAEDVDVHLYRSMIGSLMYLTASRPDIMFAVCACARDSPFNLEAFSDSDYARTSLDRKSTIGGCQFLGKRLISWQCKKHTIVANSTTEAEYVATANCCRHVLWIQNQMLDYGPNFMNTKIYIDNESTICIVKNPVFHSKTKHIEIRHHFIRDSFKKKLIQAIKIHTDHNVADLLTKAFDINRFNFLIASIGLLNL